MNILEQQQEKLRRQRHSSHEGKGSNCREVEFETGKLYKIKSSGITLKRCDTNITESSPTVVTKKGDILLFVEYLKSARGYDSRCIKVVYEDKVLQFRGALCTENFVKVKQ